MMLGRLTGVSIVAHDGALVSDTLVVAMASALGTTTSPKASKDPSNS
jgi:hypothetical protein